MCENPSSVEHLIGDPQFNIDAGGLGLFTQTMFTAGLVFNITFTEDELGQLPRWSLFDQKIMDCIAALPSRATLPPRPSNIQSSANTTLWTFVKCHIQSQRSHFGRRRIHFNPPTTPITPSMYTLEILIRELAIANPISCPDDTLVGEQLIIIGTSSECNSKYDIHIQFPKLLGSQAL